MCVPYLWKAKMACKFIIKDGIATCTECGNPIRTKQTDPTKIIRTCGKQSKPNIFTKAKNFTKAVVGHVMAGAPSCTQAQIDNRLAICQGCDFFDGNPESASCRKCGCNLSRQKNFLNKLYMADQSCPVRRWTRIYKLEDVLTIGITMFRRIDCLKRLVKSIKQFYPAVKIIVADNGDAQEEISGVDYHILPFDCGLSACRNKLIELCDTEYLLIAEEDMEFTAETRLEDFITILESNPEVGWVGGSIRNGGPKESYCTALRKFKGQLEIVPAGDNPQLAQGVVYRLCDQTFNWGVGRKPFFARHKWDESLKIVEHADYFWAVKQAAEWRVAWTDVCVNHYKDRSDEAYTQFRGRKKEFLEVYRQKWGVSKLSGPKPIYLPADKPDIIVLTPGHTGSSIYGRTLYEMGWKNSALDFEYYEDKVVREINSGPFNHSAASAHIGSLEQPFFIKDPRLSGGLLNWIPVFQELSLTPKLIYLIRDYTAVKQSFEKRGESIEVLDKRIEQCNKLFQLWPWAKELIEYEKWVNSCQSVKPQV